MVAGKASTMRSTVWRRCSCATYRRPSDRFRRRKWRLDGLQIAQLADEDDVRVLPEGALDGLRETRHIGTDLALGDDALLCACNTRSVLDGDDVPVAVLVM